MQSDLKSLLPTVYNGVLETDLLTQAGDTIFDTWFSSIDWARQNQFAYTADVQGVDALERIFGIVPDPLAETLDFRRQRVLGRMQMRVPFTHRFLKQRLDLLFGVDQHAFTIQSYHLRIALRSYDMHRYGEMMEMLERVKPANIEVTTQLQSNIWTKVYAATLANSRTTCPIVLQPPRTQVQSEVGVGVAVSQCIRHKTQGVDNYV